MPRDVGTGTNTDVGSLFLPTLSFDIEGLGRLLCVGKTG